MSEESSPKLPTYLPTYQESLECWNMPNPPPPQFILSSEVFLKKKKKRLFKEFYYVA